MSCVDSAASVVTGEPPSYFVERKTSVTSPERGRRFAAADRLPVTPETGRGAALLNRARLRRRAMRQYAGGGFGIYVRCWG